MLRAMALPGSSRRARRRSPDRGRRILVVDDEERVRGAVARLLEHAGYGVVTCGGADDALALLAADGPGFALVITDTDMPGGIDGLELARRIADHASGLGVIVLVADPALDDVARAIPSVVAIVAKAEATRVLLGPVRSALGA